MKLDYSPDGKLRCPAHAFMDGPTILFEADEVRRARDGIHARVAILLGEQDGGRILAYDTFALDRLGERNRLAAAAHQQLKNAVSTDQAAEYPPDHLAHDLDIFCLSVGPSWEQGRFLEEVFDPDEPIPKLQRVLHPYVLEGGGTILFGQPGSGKSWVALLMAVEIATGEGKLWRVEQRL